MCKHLFPPWLFDSSEDTVGWSWGGVIRNPALTLTASFSVSQFPEAGLFSQLPENPMLSSAPRPPLLKGRRVRESLEQVGVGVSCCL